MNPADIPRPDHCPRRVRISVRGIVQGVGFRPWVHQLATSLGCAGFVRNGGDGVTIELDGGDIDGFLHRLPLEAPPASMITDLSVEELAPAPGTRTFRILASDDAPIAGAFIPPDMAPCAECVEEMFKAGDRRHRHAFTSCTNCGPRFTITASLPYDRPMTSMHRFPMCTACAREYGDPSNRRYHAQPIACNDCGPHLWLVVNRDPSVADAADMADAADTAFGGRPRGDAIQEAARLLRNGAIVAIRGLGGYHLVVDAKNDHAVALLRDRKHRDGKPFALMVRDLRMAHALCIISEEEERTLTSPAAPIVLLRRRHAEAPHLGSDHPRITITAPAKDAAALSSFVAPGMSTLGVMLPSTPLHHLLLAEGFDVLVMTSGNVSDEPICIDPDEAERRLRAIADAFLHHDRTILQRCDDSIVRVIAGQRTPMRRARGMVPRPVLLGEEGASVFATGAEMKAATCVTRGRMACLSQHLGDLSSLESLAFFEEASLHMLRLFDIRPEAVAHDIHPEYASTRWANAPGTSALADALASLPRIAVQHHHAHLAACLTEHGIDERCIGVIFDGTGLGTDGTLWGGEFLVGDCASFIRAGRIRAVPMPGGERAIREPWRMGAAWLHATYGSGMEKAFPEFFARRTASEREALQYALATGINAPWTSGCGRFLDAVAALAGVCDTVTHEAQAPMLLESLAGDGNAPPYRFDILPGSAPTREAPSPRFDPSLQEQQRADDRIGPERFPAEPKHEQAAELKHEQAAELKHEQAAGARFGQPREVESHDERGAEDLAGCAELSFEVTVADIVSDVQSGAASAWIAARTHATLVAASVEMIGHVAAQYNLRTVALSGGVFQNARLGNEMRSELERRGYRVLMHRLVPPGDGGIALGQAAVARALLRSRPVR